MSSAVNIVIIGAYLTLFAELTFLHVPSVASSRNILFGGGARRSGFSTRYRRIFDYSGPRKALLLGLPLCIVYALFAFPLIVIWLADNPFDDYLFNPRPVWQLLAMAMIIVGRGVTLAATFALRRTLTDSSSSSMLQTTGPFRWSRNPGLVGMYVFITGTWCAMPSALMLTGILVYMSYMHVKVRMEEDYLENRLGNAYSDYRDRTGRYLP